MNYYDKCINMYIVGVRSLRWNGILVWGVLGELVIYLGNILAWLIVCCDVGSLFIFWEELMKEIIDREKERERKKRANLYFDLCLVNITFFSSKPNANLNLKLYSESQKTLVIYYLR